MQVFHLFMKCQYNSFSLFVMSDEPSPPSSNATVDAPSSKITPPSPVQIKRRMSTGTIISGPVFDRIVGGSDELFWVELLSSQMGFHIFQQQGHLAKLYLGSGQDHVSSMEELSEEFDQTQFGTETLFALFDADGTGFLTHDEFHSGLKSQNLLHLDSSGSKFAELVKHVDTNNDGKISLEEFQVCLERLRLARLYLLGKNMRLIGKTCSLHCVDYDSQTAVFQLPVLDQLSFFFAPDHSQCLKGNNDIYNDKFDARWIHVSGHDNLIILRLAVKFGLHPLAVLDALNLHQKAPVCAQYGKFSSQRHGDMFVVTPQLRLARQSLNELRNFQAKESELMYARKGERGHLFNQQFDTSQDFPPVHAMIEHNPTGIFFLPKAHILLSIELDWMMLSSGTSRSSSTDNTQIKLNDETCWTRTKRYLCRCGQSRFRGNRLRHNKSLSRSSASFAAQKGTSAAGTAMRRRSHVKNTSLKRKVLPVAEGSKEQTTGKKQRPAPSPPSGMPPILSNISRMNTTESMSPNAPYPKEIIEEEYGEQSLLALVLHNLSRKYTMLRRSGIERLLHTILDNIVKNFQPIARAYRIELSFYQACLHEQQAKFKKIHVANLLRVKRELKQLAHQLQPIKTVMGSLVKSGNFDDDRSFFQDIEDGLAQILFEIETCSELAIELNESFIHYHDRRMNDVLYVLTIVTTCVIPTQLFTGGNTFYIVSMFFLFIFIVEVYADFIFCYFFWYCISIVFGMNFATDNNSLGLQDPMLRWEWGYWAFWWFSIVTTLIGVFVFRAFI